MKNTIFFKILYTVAFLVVIINLALYIHDSFSYSIDELPQGKLQYSVASPTGEKSADVYLVSNSLGQAVRIAILENGDSQKNVFWQTDINDVELRWENESVISVNGMDINIAEGGTYDCRLGTSIIKEGSLEPGVGE